MISAYHEGRDQFKAAIKDLVVQAAAAIGALALDPLKNNPNEANRERTGAANGVQAVADMGKEPLAEGVVQVAEASAEMLAVGAAVKVGAAATKGAISVLGHYPGYISTAESLGGRYFNVPAGVWSKMSPAEQWVANTKFLDRLVSRGDTVVLSTPANQVRPGSWLAREIEYLVSRGYSMNVDGTRMLPGMP